MASKFKYRVEVDHAKFNDALNDIKSRFGERGHDFDDDDPGRWLSYLVWTDQGRTTNKMFVYFRDAEDAMMFRLMF